MDESNNCYCSIPDSIDTIVLIENGAINKVPELILKEGYKKALVVSDMKTYKAAGIELRKLLKEKAVEHTSYMFRSNNLLSDEINLGKLFIEFDCEADIIIGVGSGTITDICRFVSSKFKLPYIIVATAPSTNGYCSDRASIFVNGLKKVKRDKAPYAVVCDTKILDKAPKIMAYAGLGEIVGKDTCLCDWKLGNLLAEDHYCEHVVSSTLKSVKECLLAYESGEKIGKKSSEILIKSLCDMATQTICKRISSQMVGAEHDISDFWEMCLSEEGKRGELHGINVAYSSLVIIELYTRLIEKKINWKECLEKADNFDSKNYTLKVKKVFSNPSIAKEVVESDHFINTNTPVYMKKRIRQYKKNWKMIAKIIEESLPRINMCTDLISNAGLSLTPKEIGIDEDVFISSILYSKELRNHFTVLQIAGDLGLLEEFALKIVKKYYHE